jgi:hypothetical protein
MRRITNTIVITILKIAVGYEYTSLFIIFVDNKMCAD